MKLTISGDEYRVLLQKHILSVDITTCSQRYYTKMKKNRSMLYPIYSHKNFYLLLYLGEIYFPHIVYRINFTFFLLCKVEI